MKGILGRKAGMTSVFTENGRNIPVSVIEVQPNVVTSILTKDKNGYDAIQLAAFDRRDKTSSKPVLGHLKKANTSAKRIIREIRDMKGFELGSKVDATIFAPGELVDVTGTSKGKGFQGNIKRHNQHIGPKSHGGGGGSKPTRQTGSIGDVVSNKVNKGMTMPGHMGSEKVTVQNLEIVSIDAENNVILVKGSIPGPNKGFVVIKEAVKGLPNKDAIKLVNIKEVAEKNELLEEAKKVGADVNTEMSIEDMKSAINAASEAKKAEEAAEEAKSEAEEAKIEAEKVEKAAERVHEEAQKALSAGDNERAQELEEKAKSLDKQAEVADIKAQEAQKEAKEAEMEAKAAEEKSEKLQVETESNDDKEGGE